MPTITELLYIGVYGLVAAGVTLVLAIAFVLVFAVGYLGVKTCIQKGNEVDDERRKG